MNEWIGHRLVEFSSDMCQNCGNERLRHLHRVKTEDRGIIEVGCVCAANLCSEEQHSHIKDAERTMEREDVRLKRITALRDSWKVKRSKGAVRQVLGEYNGESVTIYWEQGCGFTVKLPGAPTCPQPSGFETVQRWTETYYSQRGKK